MVGYSLRGLYALVAVRVRRVSEKDEKRRMRYRQLN